MNIRFVWGASSTDGLFLIIKSATGPMAEEIEHSTSKLKDEDLAAMAAYLKSVPGSADSPAPLKAEDPVMVAGQAIYRD